MEIVTDPTGRTEALAALFGRVFAASESEAEGRIIATLVRRLLTEVAAEDLRLFAMLDAKDPVACILFTRLDYPQDARRVFLLSPVAVATERQGQGLGQRLIRHGLDALRAEGADVAVTYGDPAFYGRSGFAPVSLETLPPPHPPTQPEGWIAQALDGGALVPFAGPCRAVAPFDDPALW